MSSRPLLAALSLSLLAIAPSVHAQWVQDGVPVCTSPGSQFMAQIASDGAGGAIVAWTDRRTGVADVYAQRFDPQGVPLWTPGGVVICDAPDEQVGAVIVSDGAGGAIIAWGDRRVPPPGSAVGAAVAINESDIFAQRVNGNGFPLWIANGVSLSMAMFDQEHPSIVSDAAGGAIVFWEDRRNGNQDIYAQRVSPLGQRLWTAQGVAVCTAVNDQAMEWFVPTSVPDGAGGAIVTWHDQRSPSSDIYVRRIDASGVPQWTADGVALCTNGSNQYAPAIASDGNGGAIVAWRDHRNGSDIYARRVNSSGAALWTADGVGICTDFQDQDRLTIVTDDAGGAIVAWGLFGGSTVRAQRVDGTGMTQWVANGVAIGSDYDDGLISAAPDGANGAIVIWGDDYAFTADISGQRISADGFTQWPSTVLICAATDSQRFPFVIRDETGGVFVAWEDSRNGNSDIYAQRLSGGGVWGNPEPRITSVVDVPNDQGRFVTVRWNEGDNTAPLYYYEVYRDDLGSWSYVGALADNGTTSYSLTVPTLADSACNYPFGHQFKVVAWSGTADESNVVLGRSVDNLVPGPPLLTAQVVGNTLTLTWNRTAPDLQGAWSVYTSTSPGLAACGIGCYYDTAYDTTYTVSFGPPVPPYFDWYYAVRAFDMNCNFGVMSNEIGLHFPNTPVGNNVGVALHDPVTGAPRGGVNFAQVDTEGRTDIEITASGPTLPGTFTAGDANYYHVTTTATTTGSIEVCIIYDEGALQVPEADVRLFHYDTALIPPAWVDVTTFLNIEYNAVCGVTSHLSTFVIGAGTMSSVPGQPLPVSFALHPNIPNPFNPQTTIHYDVPAGGADVNITVYDVAGRRVRDLVDEHRGAGRWSVQWNGEDERGQRVASGLYFYRMRAGNFVETRKMVLLK